MKINKVLSILIVLIVIFASSYSNAFITPEQHAKNVRGELPSENGSLKVLSDVADAQIFIDQKPYPKNVVMLQKVKPGKYNIQIKKSGIDYIIFSKMAQVKPNEQTTVAVDINGEEKNLNKNSIGVDKNIVAGIDKPATESAKYASEKKDPLIAAAIPLLIPSGGHYYAGDWTRGLYFLGAKLVCGVVMMQTEKFSVGYGQTATRYTDMAKTAAIAWLALYVWEPYDAYQTANRFNDKLKEKYGLSLTPMQNGISLSMSYSF